ncbi:hypothetical protein Rhal01_02092 [Rubritalea halochordaticola]|uniref:Lipoprotein n=1 Tax=Rubritalea halochordaticola TaxID=714537 RepID=A0ABP9UZP0_9BACT
MKKFDVMNMWRCLLAAGALLGPVGCESEGEKTTAEAQAKREHLISEIKRLQAGVKGRPGVKREFAAVEPEEMRNYVRFNRFLFLMPKTISLGETEYKMETLKVEGREMWFQAGIRTELDEEGVQVQQAMKALEEVFSTRELGEMSLEELEKSYEQTVMKRFLLLGDESSCEIYACSNGNVACVLKGLFDDVDNANVYIDGAWVPGHIPKGSQAEREVFFKMLLESSSCLKEATWSEDEYWEVFIEKKKADPNYKPKSNEEHLKDLLSGREYWKGLLGDDVSEYSEMDRERMKNFDDAIQMIRRVLEKERKDDVGPSIVPGGLRSGDYTISDEDVDEFLRESSQQAPETVMPLPDGK